MENRNDAPLIRTVGLKKYFHVPQGELHAVDDLNLTIERGKTLGIVGESGCGKSTLGRVLLRLTEATEGQIFYNGENICQYSAAKMKQMRKKMQMIFQDPYASLDPRMSVAQLIAEPLRTNHVCKSRAELEKRVAELMDTVGLAGHLRNTYPHELDGGRRQRIGVARALARGEDLRADETLAKHADWAEELKSRYTFTEENAEEILQREVGAVFATVLEHAGVYKCTPEGREAFLRFVQSV